jgi:hypothetical protein
MIMSHIGLRLGKGHTIRGQRMTQGCGMAVAGRPPHARPVRVENSTTGYAPLGNALRLRVVVRMESLSPRYSFRPPSIPDFNRVP